MKKRKQVRPLHYLNWTGLWRQIAVDVATEIGSRTYKMILADTKILLTEHLKTRRPYYEAE